MCMWMTFTKTEARFVKSTVYYNIADGCHIVQNYIHLLIYFSQSMYRTEIGLKLFQIFGYIIFPNDCVHKEF